jgi:uncharacterized membrane protein YjgN (DUF898 family)
MDAQVPSHDPGRPAPGGEAIAVTYVERPGLLRIAIVNAILSVLTLTIYRFWARTRVRRHVWSCVRINGEPLEYTGTGMELFLGALIVFFVIGLPVVLVNIAIHLLLGPEHWLLIALPGFLTLFFLLLYGMAIYRARRYRLSRTLWRGIRGTLVGSSWAYTIRHFGALLLKIVTLGWATPAMNLMLESRITNEMQFGNQSFRFSGSAAPLYRKFALCWFLTVLVIVPLVGVAAWLALADNVQDLLGGIWDPDAPPSEEAIFGIVFGIFGVLILYALLSAVLWASYMVREMNVFASYTRYGDAGFSLAATTPSLIWLWISNLLLVILTLGIAQPYAVQRMFRYFCRRLTVTGTVDVAAMRQSQAALDKRGEGLVDAFDIDAF